jgi:hypothetical protein
MLLLLLLQKEVVIVVCIHPERRSGIVWQLSDRPEDDSRCLCAV